MFGWFRPRALLILGSADAWRSRWAAASTLPGRTLATATTAAAYYRGPYYGGGVVVYGGGWGGGGVGLARPPLDHCR